MAYKIDQQDYYFGAALALFLTHNQDSKPSLIGSWKNEDGKVQTRCYDLTTNTAPDFRIYMKHSENCKFKPRKNALSWSFHFSKKERQLISKYLDKGERVFIFLICSEDNFKNTQILVLRQDEYLSLRSPSLTVNWEMAEKERKQSFTIPNGGTPLSIECNRIEKKLTDI